MAQQNVRMAVAAIKSARWRSFLTMLGVIIGVVSVVTIVSLGEGVKHQLSAQIKHTGSDLITLRGGSFVERDSGGAITNVNLLNLFSGPSLSEADYQAVKKTEGIQQVVPLATVSGIPTAEDGTKDTTIAVVATNEHAADILNQKVLYGGFFDEREANTGVAVIGKGVAERLFKENVPIGKSFELRGKKVLVEGVFTQFQASPLTPGIDYNNAIFVPYEFGQSINGAPLQPYQILIKPKEGQSVASISHAVTVNLQTAHGGQQDFTVLTADDNIALGGSMLDTLTRLVSAIAAVSLLVGGIGIMNIMLVAVSERTHEIGIRKSIGATNKQILDQFMIEAIVLSTTGGLVGIILAYLVNYLMRVLTDLQPVITLPVVGVAAGVAVVVGIVFGITPALQAARKDPIEALRRI